jgi:cytochrome P450
MPYLDACYKESLRIDTPLIVPRYTENGFVHQGVTIPAKTIVMLDVAGVNKGEAHWKNPESFDPQRFLESNNPYKLNQFPFIPFSAGYRMCPAFNVTEHVFKTFVVCIVQNFDLAPAINNNDSITLTHLNPRQSMRIA